MTARAPVAVASSHLARISDHRTAVEGVPLPTNVWTSSISFAITNSHHPCRGPITVYTFRNRLLPSVYMYSRYCGIASRQVNDLPICLEIECDLPRLCSSRCPGIDSSKLLDEMRSQQETSETCQSPACWSRRRKLRARCFLSVC